MLSRLKKLTWVEILIVVANITVLALIVHSSMRPKRYSQYVLERRRTHASCKLIEEACSRYNQENQDKIKAISPKTLEMLKQRGYLLTLPDEPRLYRLNKAGKTFSTKHGFGLFSECGWKSWFGKEHAKAQVPSKKSMEIVLINKSASKRKFHNLQLGLISSGFSKEAVSMSGKLAFYDKDNKLRALVPWQIGGKERTFAAKEIYTFSHANPFFWCVNKSAWEREKAWLRDTDISQMSGAFCVEWICYTDESVEYF